jgi:Ca2+-binding EF-hand superfamily protein
VKQEDEEKLMDRRSDVMELFMELDRNNDGYVDRKDLIKNYHMLEQIKGVKRLRCMKGHKCYKVVKDEVLNKSDKPTFGS